MGKNEIVRDIADHKAAIEEMLEQFRTQNVADKSEITGMVTVLWQVVNGSTNRDC